MADDIDIDAIEAAGLLDGLEGQARAERAELIEWLLAEGFTLEHIGSEFAPMLMPAGRVVGDDGVYVSSRQICEDTGIDLELLEAMQRALGLPRVDDPDAPVHLRADAEAAAQARMFVDVGLTREQVIAVARVLGHGMAQTAEVMRQVVLEAVIEPGATELQIAKAYGELVQRASPLLGPLAEGVLRLQLRHGLETEAVSVAERAAGKLPGAREVTVCFADLVGFTRLGEAVPPEELENLANRLTGLARDVASPPVHFIKTIGDAVMFVSTDAAALLRAALELLAAAEKEDLPPVACRAGRGQRGPPGRRLVRQPGEPCQSRDRGGPPGNGAGRRGGARPDRRLRRLHLVFRRRTARQGHQGRGEVVSGPHRGRGIVR